MKGLTADVQHHGDRCSIHLMGYLSSEPAQPLEEAFVKAADYDKILLVFAEKTFVNSVGLAVLFDLIFPLQEKGKQVRIAEPAAHFRKVFDIVGLSKDVEIYESEEQAVVGW
jgi:anti-anti-sigma factor